MTDVEAAQHDKDGPRAFRIGILCNGPELAAWQAECVRHVQQLPFAKIVLLVVNTQPPAPAEPAWRKLRNKLASGLLLWRMYERFILDRKAAATKAVPFDAALENVPRIDCTPISSGKWRQSFDPASLEAVEKHDLDVLLRFGFGILSGEILSLPRYGIWSFHHGDPQRFRGAPPGFWEIHNGDPVTGVILQRLTETLDGGVVLHAGWFKTNAASYPKSLDRILFGAAHFVARALVELRRDPDAMRRQTPIQNSGPIYRYPRTGAVLKFLARSTQAWLADQFRSLFRHQQWTVGIIRQPMERLFAEISGSSLKAQGVDWIAESKGRFLADPFAVAARSSAGQTAIIAEEFDWTTGLGQISTIKWPAVSGEVPRPAIRSRHHLSYPYTIEHAGETWCVPECSESAEVAVYRLASGDGDWLKHKVILEGFPAVDPTLFEHDGRWWMFCTSAERGANEFLYAWHAEDLFGDWRPHPANPLKVDIRGARPAGRPFRSNGELIRPAQDCARHYGDGITFNRILKLTPEEFVEEAAGKLLPEVEHYPAGLHTISSLNDLVIVDGARWTFVPDEFRRSLRKKMGLGR